MQQNMMKNFYTPEAKFLDDRKKAAKASNILQAKFKQANNQYSAQEQVKIKTQG